MKTHPSLKLATAVAIISFSGCKSVPEYRIVTVTLPAQGLSPERRESVWLPDQIAPYAVGRYVDPRDPNIVHEGHTLYRREQTSRPNLAPPAALQFRPTFSDSANNNTVMLRDALTAELNQQRATSQALIEQAKNLDNYLRQFNTQTQEFRNALQESVRVRAQWLTVSNRLDVLEHQLHVAPPVPTGAIPEP